MGAKICCQSNACVLGDTKRFKNKKIVFVIGGPGSGKGTQCEKIVEKFGYTHLSTGDVFRSEVASGSKQGKKLEITMAEGKLVSIGQVMTLLKKAMLKTVKTANGYLIDGFPREIAQAKEFESQIKHCDFVIYFEVPDDVMLSRLIKRGESSGRTDDTEETIKKRLEIFHENNAPILEYFGDKVKKISGDGDPDQIFEEVSALFAA